jgi:hypothetical protein
MIGGTLPGPEYAVDKTTYTLTTNALTRTDYSAAGWVAGTTEAIGSASTITDVAIDGSDTDVAANWTQYPVSISYDDNVPTGATLEAGSSGGTSLASYGQAIASSPQDPRVSYYDFVGWSNSSDDMQPEGGWVFADDSEGNPVTLLTTANGVLGDGSEQSPHTLTLYAVWTLGRDVVAPHITTTQGGVPAATQGSPYTANFSEEGSNPPEVSWQVSQGTLPDGFSLSPTTGDTVQVVSPAVAALPGSYDFTLRCTNAAGLYDEENYTITVVMVAPEVVLPILAKLAAPAAVVMGGAGSAYSAANAGPGVRLKAPAVISDGGAALLGQGWQTDASGKWAAFDPDTYMSLSYNGKKLRYYATNSAGTTYSNEVAITVNPNSLYPVLGGKDRIAISSLTALDAWPEGSKYAVLATGADFKDALAASYLAGWLSAPVVLVSPNVKLNGPVKSALATLKVSKVYTVGAAVTDTMRKSVFTGSYTKVSPKGTDGVAEAIDVVKYVTGTLKKTKPTSVFITTTSGFADAMSTAAYVANPKLNMPVLYVKGLNDASKASSYVKSLKTVKTTYVLGSTKVVSAKAASQFKGVKRVYGTDRNFTAAAAFATFSPLVAKGNADGHLHSVGMAAGSDFADALGAGAAQAHLGGAVMITPPTKVGVDVHAVLDGGSFKAGVTTYKAPPIQKRLTNFCFYGLTMSTAVKKSISGYIR